MVNRNLGMFLYKHSGVLRRCIVGLPEIVTNLLLSYVNQIKVQDVVIKTIFQRVDMHTRGLGIYKMKTEIRI